MTYTRRGIRVIILSVLVLLGSLQFLTICLPVAAESTDGTTTLYFHHFDFTEFYGEIDQNPPTKENDSEFPPQINDEAFIDWLFIWLAAQTFEDYFDDE